MRITNSTLNNSFLRNLSRNLEQMQKYQNQLSSGKEVSKSSDNPLLVSKIMSIDNNIKANRQYNSNIKDTLGWVETQDSALNDVTSILHRIRNLITYGANGSLSETDRLAIRDEVNMQIEQLAESLNTNFDGRYIFGGQRTNSTPFKVEDNILKYQGDGNNIFREISQGVTLELITDGGRIMDTNNISSENNDLGLLLKNVVAAMENGDIDALSDELLGDIEKHLDNVIRVRSQIGAIYNRVEAAQSRNEAENLNLSKVLSEREDIDIAEKYMEYMVMSTVYQASLSVGSKILQPNLLDYLR